MDPKRASHDLFSLSTVSFGAFTCFIKGLFQVDGVKFMHCIIDTYSFGPANFRKYTFFSLYILSKTTTDLPTATSVASRVSPVFTSAGPSTESSTGWICPFSTAVVMQRSGTDTWCRRGRAGAEQTRRQLDNRARRSTPQPSEERRGGRLVQIRPLSRGIYFTKMDLIAVKNVNRGEGYSRKRGKQRKKLRTKNDKKRK